MSCLCGALVLASRQPESTFGSPETLVDRGVVLAGDVTLELVHAIADAVDGKLEPKAIRAAITAAGKRFRLARLREPIEDELIHGAMLGALDADWEAANDGKIGIAAFTDLHGPGLMLGTTDKRFAARPVHEAIRSFVDREAVTPDVFEAMTKSARRRSFTIANAATRDIVQTAKRELIRQVAVGAELADFRQAVIERLNSAGWTPSNPSHVETMFRTNVLGAYGQGRARQMLQPEVLELRPYWQILGVDDHRQRETHFAAMGLVLAADDEFWRTAYPPFGYNCRCRVRSLSARRGALLVVPGSSIRGLPDPGFTSGLGAVLAA